VFVNVGTNGKLTH